MTIPCVQQEQKLEDRHIVMFCSAIYFGRLSAHDSSNSNHHWTAIALVAIWEYEPNDVMKGVVKGW